MRKVYPFIVQSGLSDHYLVGTILHDKPETTTFGGRTFRKYNTEEARSYYACKDTSKIYQMNDVDPIWEFLENLIMQCVNTLCPIYKIVIRKQRPTWMKVEILEAIGDMDSLLRQLRQMTPTSWLRQSAFKLKVKGLLGMPVLNLFDLRLGNTV